MQLAAAATDSPFCRITASVDRFRTDCAETSPTSCVVHSRVDKFITYLFSIETSWRNETLGGHIISRARAYTRLRPRNYSARTLHNSSRLNKLTASPPDYNGEVVSAAASDIAKFARTGATRAARKCSRARIFGDVFSVTRNDLPSRAHQEQ